MLWTSLSSLAARGAGFATTIILTYWIDREDYGRANAANIIALTLGFFSLPGFSSELIRRKEKFSNAASWALLFSSALFILVAGITLIGADFIAAFFNAPGAASYFRLALINPAFTVFLFVGNCILCRQLRFGAQSVLELTGSLANVGAALIMAIRGFGGAAVIIGQIVREVILRLGTTVLTGFNWLRWPQWEPSLLRQMFSFSIPVYIAELLEFAATNWDNIFIAKFFGVQALGAYAVAYTIAYTPIYTITQRASAVLLSTISRFGEEEISRRQHALLRSLEAIILLLAPTSIMIMLCGPRLVLLLFPSRWTSDLPGLVAALSLVGLGLPMQFFPDYYFQAIGRPQANMIVMITKVTLMFGALFIFGQKNVTTAAWLVSSSFVLTGLAACYLLNIIDKIALRSIVARFIPGALGSAAMAIAVLVVRRSIIIESNLLALIVEISAGCLAFVLYELIFHHQSLRAILSAFRGK